MKKVLALVIILLCVMNAGLIYDAANIEYRVRAWESRVSSAEHLDDINSKILESHVYSKDIVEVAGKLVAENGILCKRELMMTEYVVTVEEENTYLKNALKESVENLERQITELNSLHDELGRAYYKIEALESALKLSQPTDATSDDEDAS